MRLIIWGGLAILPLLSLNYLLMPEINKLYDFYANMDSVVNERILDNSPAYTRYTVGE